MHEVKWIIIFVFLMMGQGCNQSEEPMVEVTLKVLPTDKVDTVSLRFSSILLLKSNNNFGIDLFFFNDLHRTNSNVEAINPNQEKRILGFNEAQVFTYNSIEPNIFIDQFSKDGEFFFPGNTITNFVLNRTYSFEKDMVYQINLILDLDKSLQVDDYGTYFFKPEMEIEILSK